MAYNLAFPNRLSLGLADFADDFFKEFYRYDRPFQEVKGYVVKQDKDGSSTVVLNALGVNPADIDIKVSQDDSSYQTLSVVGKTHCKPLEKDFSIEFYFKVRKPIRKIIKSFNSGLLFLKVEYDKPAQPKVEILEE